MDNQFTTALAIRLEDLSDLDVLSDVPLYAQLAQCLSKHIRSLGADLTGKLLPSEAEIASHLRISRPTVRQAMSRISAAGLILRIRGKGTFVAPPRAERDLGRAFDVLPANQRVTYKLLERTLILPNSTVMAALRLEKGAVVERIRRNRFHKAELIAFEERFIPVSLAESVSSEMLESDAGIVFARRLISGANGTVTFKVRAIPASATVAKRLKMRKGEPVLSSEHTYFSPLGAPVLYGTVLFRGDRYDFSFQAPIHGV